MFRLLSDENIHGPILRALRQRCPTLDLVRVCDVGLAHADDPAILEWAAVNGRILLTQDRDTMPQFAYERLEEGLPLPGVVILPDGRGVRSVVDELVLLLVASEPTEWQNQVVFLPL